MKHLLIDTSTPSMILMLQDDKKTLDISVRVGKSDHQAYIIPLIDELLKRNKLTKDDLSSVVVGVGPGSYTGLRVGVMTAKMMGYRTNLVIRKVSSLLFLTSGYKNKVYAWHDARNNQGFCALYQKGERLNEEALRHINDLSEEERSMIVNLKEDTIKVDGSIILDASEIVVNIFELVPNYLRKTEAENKLDQTSSN